MRSIFKKYSLLMWLISLSAVLSSCGMEPVPSAEPSSMTVASDSVTNAAVEETTAESTESAKESASTDKNEEEEKTESASTTTTSQKKTDKKIPLSFYETELKVGETQMPIVDDEIKEIWTSSDNDVASVDDFGNITAKAEGKCTITVADADNKDYCAEINVTVVPQPGLTYIDGILIANKTYSLPSDYNPGGLTPETSAAFEKLVQGAANDGLDIYLSSGFRSYSLQQQIYNQYCYDYGQAQADTFSARPGHSEHQTGMAIDVNIIDDSFAGTPEAIWIENHCFEYGFILRYPKGKEDITGYKYEPWHIRYLGVDTAKAVHDSGLTLEEYLGIDSKYSE